MEQIQQSTSLPMVVWLQGDEDEFMLSAEDVMAELNIKRSRLTQISGRELRVGRKRVERYVKPFYRRVDVLAYKSWTRAAITHQRSADVVSQAASSIEARNKSLLQETGDRLSESITDATLNLQKELLRAITSCKHETKSLVQESGFVQTRKIFSYIDVLQRNVTHLLNTFLNKISIQHEESYRLVQRVCEQAVTSYRSELAELATRLQTQGAEVAELKSFAQEQTKSLVSLNNYLSSELLKLRYALATAKQSGASFPAASFELLPARRITTTKKLSKQQVKKINLRPIRRRNRPWPSTCA